MLMRLEKHNLAKLIESTAGAKGVLMIIYGKQPIFYAIGTCAWRIEEIYLQKELAKDMFSKLARLNKPIKRLDAKKAQSLAHGGNHQGILAKLNAPKALSLQEIKKLDSVLVLCEISDIGNIGSIFRTAFGLGVGGIIICMPHLRQNAKSAESSQNAESSHIHALDLSQKMSEGIARLSSGAFLNMPYCVCNNALDVANELKNASFALLGADMDGESAPKATQHLSKWALFLGNESSGLSARLKHKLDTMLGIEMQGAFNSLNVAIASGILIDRINYGRI